MGSQRQRAAWRGSCRYHASEASRIASVTRPTRKRQQTSFAFGIQDPVLCPVIVDTNPNCVLDVRRVAQGNPNLKAEKSTAYTVGMVLAPTRDVTVSIDLWQIDRKDEIGAFGDGLKCFEGSGLPRGRFSMSVSICCLALSAASFHSSRSGNSIPTNWQRGQSVPIKSLVNIPTFARFNSSRAGSIASVSKLRRAAS